MPETVQPQTVKPETAQQSTPTEGAVRRGELAAFLRSRRERITPEQVGLPRGPRRRTPGLRREEVAHLSAVGVTWYTWLEQARDIHVSPQVLDAVARALQMDRAERGHLFALAGAADPVRGTECAVVTQSMRQMLDQLAPFPAVVQNSRFDILAYNSTYGRLLCDLDALPEEDRNCMWLAFTNADWRASLVELDKTLCVMAAKFRASMAGHVAEPAWKALVARLEAASPEFREIWARQEVVRPVSHTKLFRHKEVGLLRLSATGLWTGPNHGPRMLTYTPDDEESRERLERLQALTRA
ncbi:XRE family transcriptional regulator [Streptomyces rimosus subsp. rimosus]|uniref:Helix-turn-helix domain-containing protein n=3 Tax=Streptomyces TaxID=1883 RepID=A0A8A1V5E4_STRR1|nr:XRE family transcriptional regulator [Kitasatospora aureofaciens]KOT26281.1 XRE family transcriptional regulator [Streptomyces sp. NRRL WC-3701]KOT26311.1 XRE family transcriptional regulator [Streptomyces rimosus subsp. rimosus]MYT47575.1 helix-turn-helix domain-containing protein [Streptomyces sp. SID5471]QDA09852.1 XRE family transcriptional regulator [Streptomyces rimosus]QGY71740.1 helix-turn-helix domain-containing protein [Streptomyces rimosus R6-500]QST85875.1 helix-turn-helix doma